MDIHKKAGDILVPKNLKTPEVVAAYIRLNFLPELTKELKQEWRDVAKHCAQRRKDTWDDRLDKKKSEIDLEADMVLPRLAVMELERRFGPSWMGDKAAMKWASKEWPQFKVRD